VASVIGTAYERKKAAPSSAISRRAGLSRQYRVRQGDCARTTAGQRRDRSIFCGRYLEAVFMEPPGAGAGGAIFRAGAVVICDTPDLTSQRLLRIDFRVSQRCRRTVFSDQDVTFEGRTETVGAHYV